MRPSAFQAEIHKLQLELFAANQQTINETVAGYTREFRRYEARYKRSVCAAQGPTSFRALIQATLRARVVLIGDYHTLAQSQRAFFRVLRKQPALDRNVIVALEMFPGGQQSSIDRFMAGRITEETFLRRIDHEKSWPFGSFQPARTIIELCRTRRWPIIGMDHQQPGSSTLAQRDTYAASVIATALAKNPAARVFALVGDMHLAPPHLPRALDRELSRRGLAGRVLRVHQNPERIWFDQAAKGLIDEHDVMVLEENAFALLTASPVVCQQSFLTWVDLVQEGTLGIDSLDGNAGERGFREALSILGRALKLPTRHALKSVEIVGPADLTFFEQLHRSGRFTARELRKIRAQILSSESYYIPKARLVYLATLSLNHAAEEASHFLRHHLSGEGVDDPKGLVDAFYCRVMNEAIGFLGSKIVNPKRKCVHVDELAVMARGWNKKGGITRTAVHSDGGVTAKAARFALAHKRMEFGAHVDWLSQVFHASPDLFNAVTHILGYILGDHLYYGLVRGKLSRENIRALFYEPFEEEGAALLLYLELTARLGRLRTPRRP